VCLKSNLTSKDFWIKLVSELVLTIFASECLQDPKLKLGEGTFEDSLFESTNLFVAKGTMSKALMKLRLQKDMNRQIQKENSELRMQLQYLEDEKQELQDQLVSHEEFLMGIIQELESELQAKDKMLAQFHKVSKWRRKSLPCKRIHLLQKVYRW
jgi:septal ring factor EnvC (AmiA/AmiB activator)